MGLSNNYLIYYIILQSGTGHKYPAGCCSSLVSVSKTQGRLQGTENHLPDGSRDEWSQMGLWAEGIRAMLVWYLVWISTHTWQYNYTIGNLNSNL